MKYFLLFVVSILVTAQHIKASIGDTAKLYNPYANATEDIANAVKKAGKEDKLVLLQAGGNWCSWCIKFNKFVHADKQLDSAVNKNYIVYHLNYSPENKNQNIFEKYLFPQRFGFPAFLILDSKGNLLHTQNSAYLEEGKGYSKEKILEFFSQWNIAAFNPANYKD